MRSPHNARLRRSPDAILPFLEEEAVTLNRDNSVTFELRIDPGDADSPKVRYAVRKITGEESPHEIVAWANTLHTHVFPGLGADTGPLKKAVLNNLLSGTSHNTFVTKLRLYTTATRLR